MAKEYALSYPDGLLTDEGTTDRAEILDSLVWSIDTHEMLKSINDVKTARTFEGVKVVSRSLFRDGPWEDENVSHDEIALTRLAKEARGLR